VSDAPHGLGGSGNSKSGWVVQVTRWLGLPSAVVALLALIGQSPAVVAPYLSATLVVTVAASIVMSSVLWPLVRDWPAWWRKTRHMRRLRRSLGPPILRPSMQRVSEHRELMVVHIRMLRMTVAELAQRAGLSEEQASYVLTYPDFVPFENIQVRLRTAIMVPPTWPIDGYGDACTIQRLLWYTSKDEGIWTLARIEATTPKSRAAALRALEGDLLRGLRRSSHA
jgi:hypothetical protein